MGFSFLEIVRLVFGVHSVVALVKIRVVCFAVGCFGVVSLLCMEASGKLHLSFRDIVASFFVRVRRSAFLPLSLIRLNLWKGLESVSFQLIRGNGRLRLSPVYSSSFSPRVHSPNFLPCCARICYKCGVSGHIRMQCRNAMKCFFVVCWPL